MSPGEKLDPLPDTFILQPPVFHPVSICSDLEPPGSQGSVGPRLAVGGWGMGGWRGPQSWAQLPQPLPMGSGNPPELSDVADSSSPPECQ